jgi:hypothetical protein
LWSTAYPHDSDDDEQREEFTADMDAVTCLGVVDFVGDVYETI